MERRALQDAAAYRPSRAMGASILCSGSGFLREFALDRLLSQGRDKERSKNDFAESFFYLFTF